MRRSEGVTCSTFAQRFAEKAILVTISEQDWIVPESPLCSSADTRLRSYCILRSQPGAVQQLLQLIRRKRLLHVVDALETDPFRSQDTLDVAALGSRRLLVNDDLTVKLHFTPFGHEHCCSSGLACTSEKQIMPEVQACR